MPVKIRLQRHGRKGVPFYHIVVADARAPRDGKYIEKLGVYNPLTSPATIDLDVDKAVNWLKNGAQPTDTTRAILSFKGVLYKKHLDTGILKGSITAEVAGEKFTQWEMQKASKILDHTSSLKSTKEEEGKKRFLAEQKIKEDRTTLNNARKLAELTASNAELSAATLAENTSGLSTELPPVDSNTSA